MFVASQHFPSSVSSPSILLENFRKTLTTLFEHFHYNSRLFSEQCWLPSGWMSWCVMAGYKTMELFQTSISLRCPLGQHLLIEINCDSSDQFWPVRCQIIWGCTDTLHTTDTTRLWKTVNNSSVSWLSSSLLELSSIVELDKTLQR